MMNDGDDSNDNENRRDGSVRIACAQQYGVGINKGGVLSWRNKL